MALIQITLFNSPNFIEDIQLDGSLYQLAVKWNTRSNSWLFDLFTSDDIPLIYGHRLVINYPLLYNLQYDRRMPQGLLFIVSPSDLHRPIRRNDFEDGKMVLLYDEVA